MQRAERWRASGDSMVVRSLRRCRRWYRMRPAEVERRMEPSSPTVLGSGILSIDPAALTSRSNKLILLHGNAERMLPATKLDCVPELRMPSAKPYKSVKEWSWAKARR